LQSSHISGVLWLHQRFPKCAIYYIVVIYKNNWRNIDDHVNFNDLSDLDVFTWQYIGTSLQGKIRDDFMSVIDEEENNSTNAGTELFASQYENDSKAI